MSSTTPQANVADDQEQVTVPLGVEPIPALPPRHVSHFRPAGWCAPALVPTDPDVLLKVKAALKRL
jgi:hypothetical protein